MIDSRSPSTGVTLWKVPVHFPNESAAFFERVGDLWYLYMVPGLHQLSKWQQWQTNTATHRGIKVASLWHNNNSCSRMSAVAMLLTNLFDFLCAAKEVWAPYLLVWTPSPMAFRYVDLGTNWVSSSRWVFMISAPRNIIEHNVSLLVSQ